jgi:hypothetical protein
MSNHATIMQVSNRSATVSKQKQIQDNKILFDRPKAICFFPRNKSGSAFNYDF